MYTSLLIVALSSAPAAAPVEAPTWMTDYSAAKKQCAKDQKPLAVFIGTGKNGWKNLSQDGDLGASSTQTLKASYVCVYIDASTAQGQRLAAAFEISEGLGIIISNRDGKLQAFRHEGELAEATLARYLEQFSDPKLDVKTTVTNPGPHGHQQYQPSGYCPNCPTCPNGRCYR